MKKFLKLVITGTIVLGASTVMALDGELGIQGESPGFIATECYVYNADKNLVIGVVLDAYNEDILDEDENIIGNTAVMKCALPKPKKKPRHDKPTTTDDQVSYVGDGTEICISPKTITEKIDEVKDEEGNIITEEVDAILEDYASTTVWKNIVSASGEVSLVCKQLQTASENQPPVAIAGTEQTISICDALVMDGTGSSDPDGSIVKYVWSVSDGAIILGEGATPTLAMAGRTPGTHEITLTVTDNEGATNTDTVTIIVNGADEDYDFSYIIKNPIDGQDYVTSHPDAIVTTEGPNHYWRPSASETRGYVNLDFQFPGSVEIAYLYARINTFNWYGNKGEAWIRGSSDGTNWEQLAYSPPPPNSSDYRGGSYNDFVPDEMIGANSILIQSELISLGWTNLAQFLRHGDNGQDNITFKLNVCHDGEQEIN